MAKDLKLDIDEHDLFIANYDLALVEDIDNVRQALSIRLKFFFGEWFLDNTQGIKLYQIVYVKNPDMDVIASVFKAVILETPNVLRITSYEQSMNRETRKLTVTFSVETTFGSLTQTEEL